MSASAASDPAWRDYWKADRLASCVPESERAGADIAAFWKRIFADLPSESRILDIATGNGAVLAEAGRLARETGKRFARTGVDLAEIDPPRYVSDREGLLTGVRFQGNVAAEALPFEPACFDCVVSQYGLEYAELDPALAEAARALRPGGRLTWLAHSAESAVVAQNRAQIAEIELLLGEIGPLPAMEGFVAALAGNERVPRQARATAAAAVQQAQKAAARLASRGIVDEVTAGLAQVLKRPTAYRPDDLRAMLADSRQRLTAHRARMQALIGAALDAARLETVQRCLQQPDWRDLRIEPFEAGASRSRIGLAITARRAEA